MPQTDEKFETLYGHWVVADAVSYWAKQKVPGIPDSLSVVRDQSRFWVVRVWYGLLYVVVEGYRDLKLSDPKIDTLLARTDMTEALRRFRNAMFHPQENPLSDKMMDCLRLPNSEVWIRDLNRAMETFFEETSPVKERVERAKAILHAHGMKVDRAK